MTARYYFRWLRSLLLTSLAGLGVTARVFSKVNRKGAATIQYPEQRDTLPLGSRGLLFNDVEDCISCRQCAVVCPVDCITIEAQKKNPAAPPEYTKGGVRKTLDLTRFEIDTALCCYCGLCSAACPTDCLYHTKEYEYSKYDRDNLKFDYLNFKL